MSFKRFRYKFPLLALLVVLNCLTFSSCSSSKKTVSSNKPKYISEDEMVVIKSTYYEATKKKILGEYDAALSLFRQCIALDPGNAAAEYEMADILEYEKQPDSALIFIAQAVQMDPNNIWYQELYAQCLQDKSRYKEVEGVYRNLVTKHPNVADYYYKMAAAQLQQGNVLQAAGTYEEAQQKLGFNEQVSMNVVELYERAKDYTDAEKKIEDLISRFPATPQYDDMLGNLFEMEGKSDKAFEVYQKMEKTSPDDPMVHLSLADYYRERKDEKMAFEELELAFKQPSLDIDTKMRILITSFYQTSRGTDSLAIQGMELCKLMIEADPKEAKAYSLYGDFLYRSRDALDARNEYRAAIGLDSSKSRIWSQLLAVDEQLGDFDALANDSKLAISLFPTNPNGYLMNAEANHQLKKYKDAVSSLQQGVAYVVDDTATLISFFTEMGEDNNATKNYKASDSAYEQALKLYPDDDFVLNNYSYFLSLRDTNLGKAALMSRRSNDLKPNEANYEDTYAWILYKSGKYQDAKDWEDKAMLHGGKSHIDILDHYGDILFKLQDKNTAVEFWQKAKDGGMQSDLLDKKIRDKQLYEK
jgi:tetratricopeptide (TPR) repeat protein